MHLSCAKQHHPRRDCVSCCRNVEVLRASAMSWVPVLCAAFVEAAPEARGPLGEALAAYACICAPDVVAGFFRTAVQKLIKVPCCGQITSALCCITCRVEELHVLCVLSTFTESQLMRCECFSKQTSLPCPDSHMGAFWVLHESLTMS